MDAEKRDDDFWEAAARRRQKLRERGEFDHPLLQDEEQEQQGPPKYGWLDVFAFTVAAYQVLLPFLAAMIGVGVLVYLLLWLWAR